MTTQPSLFDNLDKDAVAAETVDARDAVHESLMLANFAEQAYLDYAISVVKGRALPDVTDGQKPVQRRILYAMEELRLNPDAKPRKSAAVVGDVLGKLHPHGDQSVYDAMVRMAQDFTMRYPLVDGHGNFGSRDGDGAAAMRYTEAKLTPISQLLLSEIDQGTVEFQDNYDGSSQEPKCLPARLPFTLLNGASGIAVGMATEIPSHNLNEVANAAVAVINNPDISLEELMQIMPGPDFPGGGQIITSPDAIADIYRTGRGSVKVRARWKIEDLARGQWQVVITELPPGTSTQKVLEEIGEITNPKVRAGKKTLSAEQVALRQQFLNLLENVRDEAGREAAVRIVLEPKSRRIDPNTFMQTLLTYTSLEGNVPINMVMIGIDERPRQKNLQQILREWITFRFQTVRNRCTWQLNRVDERIHILEGRHIVLLHIDDVIRIIRESDEPKPALIEAYNLSERQADDILEIRLRQLARLEKIKIEQELASLQSEKQKLEDLLGNERSMKRQIIREIEADRKQFGDARRTLIKQAEKANIEQKIADEPVTVIISQNGWLRQRAGHNVNEQTLSFKTGDAKLHIFLCRSTDTLLAFSSTGRIYTIAVHQLPSNRGDGLPVTTFAEIGVDETISHYLVGQENQNLLLATSTGYGFTSEMSNMTSRIRHGKQFATIESNEELLPPQVISETHTHVALLASSGRLLIIEKNQLRERASGGRGVILMALGEDEQLLCATPIDQNNYCVQCRSSTGKVYTVDLTSDTFESHLGSRAKKGKMLQTRFTPIDIIRKADEATN